MADVVSFDLLTGEVTERDFTPEELAQREEDVRAAAVAEEERAARTARRSEVLNRLGITEEEARLIWEGFA